MKFIVPFFFFGIFGCSIHSSHVQVVNAEKMLLGNVTINELFETFETFEEHYKSFTPSDSILETVNNYKDSLRVEIFFGSWCGDSKRNLSPFLKIFDSAGNSRITYILHGLDRSKVDLRSGTEAFRIKRVPTLVFLRNNEEMGRFTEFPKTDIESDLILILRNAKK